MAKRKATEEEQETAAGLTEFELEREKLWVFLMTILCSSQCWFIENENCFAGSNTGLMLSAWCIGN